MKNIPPRSRLAAVGASLILALLMIIIVVNASIALPLDANLDGSTKKASASVATPGQTLRYTIVISNSGDLHANNVLMTDTLPISVTYQGGLAVNVDNAFTIGYGESNGVITWTGSLGEQGQAAITFNARLTDTLMGGEVITNTAVITGAGTLFTRLATTSVITETTLYFPIIFKAVPTPYLLSLPRPTSSNQWAVSWNAPDPNVTAYQLQEDDNAAFSSPVTYDIGGATTSHAIQHNASTNTHYCYRVRAFINAFNSDWSNARCLVGNYRDDFNDPSTGWTMRRQDTDSVVNQTYYRDGHFVMEMDSSWDYQIAGPMVAAPTPPYRLETRVKLVGRDNLHSYGLIFGGDWNGQQCPNADYSSCFNHYYRLNVIWFTSAGKMKYDLKRIDYHDPRNNAGRGDTLISTREVDVNSPAEGYQNWAVEVSPAGKIKIFVNGGLVGETTDTRYIGSPYFGSFSSTDEYNGLEAYFDWYESTALP